MGTEKKQNRFDNSSRWIKLGLIIMPAILLIIMIEGGTRLLIWKFYGTSNAGMHWAFEYEPYLLTKVGPIPREYSSKGDRYRIVLIGGSTAQQVPVDVLESAFETITERDVEVINLGKGGYIINQERIMLLLYGITSKPDLIVSLNGINDIVTSTKLGKPGITYSSSYIAFSVEHPILNGMTAIFRKSQFFNSINKLRERRLEKGAQYDSQLIDTTMSHIEEGLISIAIIAHGMSIPYVAVLQPYIDLRRDRPDIERVLASNYEYRREFMSEFVESLNDRLTDVDFPGQTYYVDGTKAFDESELQCFVDEVHLTSDGNRLIANYIVNALKRHGFSIQPR